MGPQTAHLPRPPPSPASSLDDTTREAVFRELDETRRRWEAEYTPAHPPMDFGTAPLGGGWTEANKHKGVDRVQCVAETPGAGRVCEQAQMKPMSFIISRCTEAWAAALAWHWNAHA